MITKSERPRRYQARSRGTCRFCRFSKATATSTARSRATERRHTPAAFTISQPSFSSRTAQTERRRSHDPNQKTSGIGMPLCATQSGTCVGSLNSTSSKTFDVCASGICWIAIGSRLNWWWGSINHEQCMYSSIKWLAIVQREGLLPGNYRTYWLKLCFKRLGTMVCKYHNKVII